MSNKFELGKTYIVRKSFHVHKVGDLIVAHHICGDGDIHKGGSCIATKNRLRDGYLELHKEEPNLKDLLKSGVSVVTTRSGTMLILLGDMFYDFSMERYVALSDLDNGLLYMKNKLGAFVDIMSIHELDTTRSNNIRATFLVKPHPVWVRVEKIKNSD